MISLIAAAALITVSVRKASWMYTASIILLWGAALMVTTPRPDPEVPTNDCINCVQVEAA